MQIAPIRPYNISQKQNQQNTNFKGVALKLDISSPVLLKYIDSCKEPPAEIVVIKKEILNAIRKLQDVCNSHIPSVLEKLLHPYRTKGLVDRKIDYEKLAEDIWPNDTEVIVQLKDAVKKTQLDDGFILNHEFQKFVGKSGDKEYTIVEMENEAVLDFENKCFNIYGNIYHPISTLKDVVRTANNPLYQDLECVKNIKNFTETMLKDQPGYKKLIKTLEKKANKYSPEAAEARLEARFKANKAYKSNPEATEARRKAWLEGNELGVDAKVNRLLEALSPEEIEVLKKHLLK